MLAQARTRLGRFGERVRFTEASFLGALPRCNGAAASLALHHVRTLDAKRSLYQRIHDALEPGGVFVNADATMPADPAAGKATWSAWADHMVRQGIARERAFRHFEEWADEDTYFPLEGRAGSGRRGRLRRRVRVWREVGMAGGGGAEGRLTGGLPFDHFESVDSKQTLVVSCQHGEATTSQEGCRARLGRGRERRLDGRANSIRPSLGRHAVRRTQSFRMSGVDLVDASQPGASCPAATGCARPLSAHLEAGGAVGWRSTISR